jgi:PAS domain-containing protein
MRRLCSWCKKELDADHTAGGPVVEGMCAECAASSAFQVEPLRDLLDRLPTAVLAVDGRGRILGASSRAAALLQHEPDWIEGRLTGDVMSCAYAERPEGCGQTVHCDGCTIKRAVDHTRKTGEASTETLAFAYVHGPRGVGRVWYRISTERIAGLVLLQIDAAWPEEDDAASAGATLTH